MLTGTHLLQSCGIVLCEIETAEHQEQLFAINLNSFTTLKVPPLSTTTIPTFPPSDTSSHTSCHSLCLFFVSSSPFRSSFSLFYPPLSSSAIFALLVSLRPAEHHVPGLTVDVQAWLFHHRPPLILLPASH